MTQYGVVLFYTTSSVMRAEKLLQKEGLPSKLVPTPRQFSSDCGIALRFSWDDSERATNLLNEAKVEYDAIHILDEKDI